MTIYFSISYKASTLTGQFQGRPSKLYQVAYSISLIFPNMRHLLFYYVRRIVQKVLNVHVAVISDEVTQQRL